MSETRSTPSELIAMVRLASVFVFLALSSFVAGCSAEADQGSIGTDGTPCTPERPKLAETTAPSEALVQSGMARVPLAPR